MDGLCRVLVRGLEVMWMWRRDGLGDWGFKRRVGVLGLGVWDTIRWERGLGWMGRLSFFHFIFGGLDIALSGKDMRSRSGALAEKKPDDLLFQTFLSSAHRQAILSS